MTATVVPGINSLNIYIEHPIDTDGITPRDDLIGVKVWYSKSNNFNIEDSGVVLGYDGTLLDVQLMSLENNTTYYIRYALISEIEPDNYIISTIYTGTTLNTITIYQDLTPPPPPSNLIVTEGYSILTLNWTPPAYTTGGGPLNTLIYAAKQVTQNAPSITEAKLIGTAEGASYIFSAKANETWLFWVRNQSKGLGLSEATGPQAGTTAVDVEATLASLSDQISETQLSKDLNDRIDIIDIGPNSLVDKVSGLITTYGDTASSAASAASAAQSAADAVQAKADAIIAKEGAANSATTASTKAQEASTSATNAAGSAAAANTSATTAATAAINANNSATAAATSATSASGYATSAETASTASSSAKVAAEAARDAASGSATAAATSASTATTKATEASQSATSASTSANTASTKAGQASTSATNAANSETNAASSASSASTSATNAATSATNAGNSATAAATSASTATTKATEASQSATSASTSANTASTKAGQASTSATNAANSETNAASSASSAYSSSVTAAGSATDANNFANAASSSASTASTKATEAGQSATSAYNSANTASSKASDAGVYARNAADSATAANGSATSAATALTQVQATIRGTSLGLPLEQWYKGSHSIVSISDGKVGSSVLRIVGAAGSYPNQGNFVPIDPTRKYRVRFWARPSADASGYLYFSLRQFITSDGSTAGPINGGRSPYKPSGQSRAAHIATYGNTWGEYNYVWSASDWQSGVKYVQPEFLDNYSNGVGYWDIQGYTFYDVTENENLTATVQTLATTVAGPDGTTAQYTVKLDTNNYISGFGLSSTSRNDVNSSEFIIRADRFAFGAPGKTSKYPFVIDANGVWIDAANIKDATITKAKIGDAEIDSAKIASIDATKINAGSLRVNQYLQSSNYSAGTAGWRISSDDNGSAEFNNVSVRGSVASGQTAFNTGTGVWIGSDGKFSVGDGSTNYLNFDSTGLHIKSNSISLGSANTNTLALGYGTSSSGSNNTYIGVGAGTNLMDSTGDNSHNIIIGSGAVGYLGGNTGKAFLNTIIGTMAGGRLGGTTTFEAYGNTMIGDLSGLHVTTGSYNTLIGQNAGSNITTGSGNIVIGGYGGSASVNNNIYISDGNGTPSLQIDNNTCKFYSVQPIFDTGNKTLYPAEFCRASINFCSNFGSTTPNWSYNRTAGSNIYTFNSINPHGIGSMTNLVLQTSVTTGTLAGITTFNLTSVVWTSSTTFTAVINGDTSTTASSGWIAPTILIKSSFNVTSVTDNGVGDFNINFGSLRDYAFTVVATGSSPMGYGASNGLVISELIPSYNGGTYRSNYTVRLVSLGSSFTVQDVYSISVAIFR